MQRFLSWTGWFLLILLLVFSGAWASEIKADIVSLSKCPAEEAGCLIFDVTIDKSSILKTDIKEGQDYGIAFVRVSGRLAGGETQDFVLSFAYPDDLLGCRDSKVAAVGAKTILTYKGEFEILDDSVKLGNEKAVATINRSTKEVRFHLAPTWEMHLWRDHLFVDAHGKISWQVKGQCLSLDGGERLFMGTDAGCQQTKLSQPSKDDLGLVKSKINLPREIKDKLSDHDIWSVKGTPYLLWIWGAACT